MLATFCVRLALGLVACLLLLPARQLHPRFFRTHFLTALGLLVVATLTAWPEVGGWPRGLLAAGTALTLLGALSWTLAPAPGGRAIVVLTAATLVAALMHMTPPPAWTLGTPDSAHALPESPPALLLADHLTSAALLGSAMTAMLIGHSYLISPGMSLSPLMRLLAALGVALGLRAVVIGAGLWLWTADAVLYNLTGDAAFWLPVRWLVGVVAPLVFGWMAYASARIRSTQSATGILYVAVVCGFLGELLGLLLTRQTGLPL
jgi:hypothetical protein